LFVDTSIINDFLIERTEYFDNLIFAGIISSIEKVLHMISDISDDWYYRNTLMHLCDSTLKIRAFIKEFLFLKRDSC